MTQAIGKKEVEKLDNDIKRFKFKVDRCTLHGLINDSNVILASVQLLRSTIRTGNGTPELQQAERILWSKYVDAKNKFESHCSCSKIK
jgi:hypothetical protein